MSTSLKKFFNHQVVFLSLAFLVSTLLYWSALNGQPIWDDFYYLFQDKIITQDFSYWWIFRDFAWPVSVSLEKLLYQIWHEQYLYYHLLNLLLHFLNSWLVLKVAQRLNLPFQRFIFLLFLLHPSNVISVAWMIQLKTLLCFTFGIIAFQLMLKGQEDKKFMPLAWLSFLISVLAKSASLPLAAIFLLVGWHNRKRSPLVWMLPFFLISTYSSFKILKSDVTAEGAKQVVSKSFVAADSNQTKVTPPSQPLPAPAPKPATASARVPPESFLSPMFLGRLNFFLKTTHFYFWQTIIPLENYPVKGQPSKVFEVTDMVHFAFLIMLLFLTWGKPEFYGLVGGYLMLSPFMGLFTAPYMNLTWVSEQHMYLALPFFIYFWMGLLSRIDVKLKVAVPVIFVGIFSLQTFRANKYFENEIAFYTASLKSDPRNIPIAYNLANAYLKKEDLQGALKVTGTILEMSQYSPDVKRSKYLPFVISLHGKMVRAALKQP